MTLPDFEGSIGFQIRAVPPLDVGGDGDLDLVLLFRKRGTGLLCGDVEASLTGDTFTGRSFVGSDSVTVIGCPP